MIDRLKDIFDNVNNWLKFAEAKNGAIIALNSALIFGVLRLYSAPSGDNIFRDWYVYGVVFLLTISIVVAIISFIPKLDFPFLFKEPKDSDNLLYFADIAKYLPNEYQKKITGLLNEDSSNPELEKFYINQIVVNAKITYIKYKQFDIAVWFILTAFLTPIGTAILFWYKSRN